jgi:hypothetical protein
LSTAKLKSQKGVKNTIRMTKKEGVVTGLKSLVDFRHMQKFQHEKSERLKPLSESLLQKEERAQARGTTMLDLLGGSKVKPKVTVTAIHSDADDDSDRLTHDGDSDAESLASTKELLNEIISEELQTNGEALSNLLNTCLDSALLTVAFGLRQCGLIVGLFVMVVSAYVNQNNVLLNLKCCSMTNTSQVSYEFSRIAFGRIGEVAFIVFNTVFPFLQMVSYIFAARDAVKICLAELVFPKYADKVNGGLGNHNGSGSGSGSGAGINHNDIRSATTTMLASDSPVSDSTIGLSLAGVGDAASPTDNHDSYLHYLHDFLFDDTVLKCGLWLLLFTPLTYKRDMGSIGAMSWFAFAAAIICCVCVVAHMVLFLIGPASQLSIWTHHEQHRYALGQQRLGAGIAKGIADSGAGNSGTSSEASSPSGTSKSLTSAHESYDHTPPSILSVFGQLIIGSGVLWPTGWIGLCCGIPVLALLFCGEYGAQVRTM